MTVITGLNTSLPVAALSRKIRDILMFMLDQMSGMRPRLLRQRCKDLEQQLERNSDDLAAFEKAAFVMGEHLLRLEQQVRRLVERQDQLEMYSSNSRPYSQAIQLVQRGASVEELISTCGLTRGEAELICVLHGTPEAHEKSGQDSAQH